MYKVNDDKRSLYSCSAIYDALVAMIGEGKALDSIAISELMRRANISRGTFYKHFDSLVDVIVWKCDAAIRSSVYVRYLQRDNPRFLRIFFQWWAKDHSLLEVLRNIGRLDLLLYSLEDAVVAAGDILFKDSTIERNRRGYLVDIWSVVMWSILCTWIRRGYKESPQQLAEMALHNLPDISKSTKTPRSK